MKAYQIKTDSSGKEHFVPLTKLGVEDDGIKKHRNRLTHLKPKKKKRKKS